MAFRTANFAHLAKFNSSASADLIELYEDAVYNKIKSKNSEPSHRTFAPSAFRCDRRSWFRLRGAEPDAIEEDSADLVLNFKADIGTACHRIIQRTLKDTLGDSWVDVETYIKNICFNYDYTVDHDEEGLETQVEIKDPPVRFACDGILLLNGEHYLLEIKTSEFGSFNDLTGPKPIHVDQVKFYATLLNLHKVLMLYQDRQYGGLKCYEYKVTDSDMQSIWDKIHNVQKCVEMNIAPERLPTRNQECSITYCPYFEKCKDWG